MNMKTLLYKKLMFKSNNWRWKQAFSTKLGFPEKFKHLYNFVIFFQKLLKNLREKKSWETLNQAFSFLPAHGVFF